MKTTFEIIEKSEKFNLITNNNILVLFLFLLIYLASLLQKILFFKVLAMISILLLTIFFCTKSFRIANFDGKIIGKLIFYDSKISINEREIFIYDLKSIFLRMNDYYGKQKSYKTTIPLSNGTNNLLDLELKSGEKIKLFFRIDYEETIEELSPFLYFLVDKNIISAFQKKSFLETGILETKNYITSSYSSLKPANSIL